MLTHSLLEKKYKALHQCVIACFKRITRLWNSRYANCSTSNNTNVVHQELYTNREITFPVRSGTRPDLPDFAVLGILVRAMTSQGHRTIRKWCSPSLNGYSFSRQMFMAMEAVGAQSEGVTPRVPGNLSEYCLLLITSDFVESLSILFRHNAHMTDFQLKWYLIWCTKNFQDLKTKYSVEMWWYLIDIFPRKDNVRCHYNGLNKGT